AGTGFPVTIDGTGFGSTQDSSTVSFFYKAGEPRIEAPVISWSDTSIVCEVPVGTINSYPASASSGPVIVHTAGGDSNGYDFFVTFSYMGIKWPGASPMEEKLWINPNTADCAGEWRAVIDAMQTWNDVDNADFYFEYGGPTTATDFSPNGINEIAWVHSSRPYIAACYIWGVGDTITECDVIFNDSDYTWDTSGSPTASEMDVQNIAVHELGHCLSLRDLYGGPDSEKTMYGFGSYGQTKKRTLEPEDVAGIRWIYPGTGARGQYHIRVTNNDDDNLTVYFKSDIDAGYRNIDVLSGQIVTSWWEVVPSGSRQVTIKWTDPDRGTEDILTSAWLNVPV
ncbi:MAG: matrixin family metalloprotease, partial [Dehalococcoidia bacterium]|nr:matrixin family metalloprotease [Dehalococcoidia bacterium]